VGWEVYLMLDDLLLYDFLFGEWLQLLSGDYDLAHMKLVSDTQDLDKILFS
jgi:hypothetical protein